MEMLELVELVLLINTTMIITNTVIILVVAYKTAKEVLKHATRN